MRMCFAANGTRDGRCELSASVSCFWRPTLPTSPLWIYGPSGPPNVALRE
jgi:hypothetical protein